MIHKDYIMRLLNQFARGMAQILAKRALGDHPGALDEVADVLHELFGLQPRFFHQLSEFELKTLVKSGGRFNAEKAFMMAELLREYAEISEETDGADQDLVVPLFLNSARLYVDAFEASEKIRTGEFKAPFHRLCERLEDFELPADLLQRLMGCHQTLGAFSMAEDVLYRLMDIDEGRGIKAGLSFYEGLLERTDEDLEEGDLPRNEVEEGLCTVQERQKTWES
jgi:hypothetical protein